MKRDRRIPMKFAVTAVDAVRRNIGIRRLDNKLNTRNLPSTNLATVSASLFLLLISGFAFAQESPTDITLSSESVAENQAAGTAVGTFSTTDADSSTFTYTLVPGPGATGNASFGISDDVLQTDASFDFETQDTYSIRVQTDDGESVPYEEAFTITVTDVNDAPVLAAIGNQSVDEGATLNIALSASDADVPADTLTFSTGTLPGFCSLTDSTGPSGNLQCTPGFDDAAGSPYSVTVTVTDGNAADNDSETFNISVGDVNQAPVLDAISKPKSVEEGSEINFKATARDAV